MDDCTHPSAPLLLYIWASGAHVMLYSFFYKLCNSKQSEPLASCSRFEKRHKLACEVYKICATSTPTYCQPLVSLHPSLQPVMQYCCWLFCLSFHTYKERNWLPMFLLCSNSFSFLQEGCVKSLFFWLAFKHLDIWLHFTWWLIDCTLDLHIYHVFWTIIHTFL